MPKKRRFGFIPNKIITPMNQDQAAEILLIRTVEEFDEDVFTEEKIKDALKKAGDPVGQTNWFARRPP